MREEKNTNIYETFVFIFVLTFIGGFLNAYTYILNNGYLSTMNTGNMARLGISIYIGEMSQVAIYIFPIILNCVGVVLANILKDKIENQPNWQSKCLKIEIGFFLILCFLPINIHRDIAGIVASIIGGFQLTLFMKYNGQPFATTIASGNIRCIGENIAKVIVNPNIDNLTNCVKIIILTSAFVIGIICGAELSDKIGKYSILVVVILILLLLVLEKLQRNVNKDENKINIEI